MLNFTGLSVGDKSTMRQESGTAQRISEPELLTSLFRGTRDALLRVTKLPKIPIIRSNAQALAYIQLKDVAYPRGYLRFSTHEQLDQLNNVTLNRRGFVAYTNLGDATRKLNARVYPIQVSGEFHLLSEDAKLSNAVISDMLTLRAGRNMGLHVIVADAFDYKTQIQFEPSINTDETDYASEDRKAVADLIFPFNVRGWIGAIDMTVVKQRAVVKTVVAPKSAVRQTFNEMLEEQEKIYAKNPRP